MQLAKEATANATHFPQPSLVAEVLSGGGNAVLTLWWTAWSLTTAWSSAQTGLFTYSIQEVQSIQEPFKLQGLDNNQAALTPDSTL